MYRHILLLRTMAAPSLEDCVKCHVILARVHAAVHLYQRLMVSLLMACIFTVCVCMFHMWLLRVPYAWYAAPKNEFQCSAVGDITSKAPFHTMMI